MDSFISNRFKYFFAYISSNNFTIKYFLGFLSLIMKIQFSNTFYNLIILLIIPISSLINPLIFLTTQFQNLTIENQEIKREEVEKALFDRIDKCLFHSIF